MRKKNYIDEMVEVFGYDYVIGYCLCQEYDTNKKANKEEDAEKAIRLAKTANKYKAKAEQLIKERVSNGL